MVSIDNTLSAVASSAVVMLVGSVIGRGVALATEALIARSLGPTVFGQVGLAYTVILTISSVLLIGINQSIPRLLPATDSEMQQASLIHSAYLFTLIVGLVGVASTILVVSGQSKIHIQSDMKTYLLYFTPFLVVYPISRVSISVLRAWELSIPAILSRAVVSRILGVIIWAIILLFGFEIKAAIIYWLAVPFISTVVAVYFIRTRFPLTKLLSLKPDREVTTRLLQFSWPLATSSLMFMFLSRMDILMIGYFLPPIEVGYYKAIQPLRQITVLMLGSFGFVFLPLATKYYEEGNLIDLELLFTSVTKWIVIITLPVILGFTLFSDSIVIFLFGSSYLPAAFPLSVLLGGLFIRVVTGLDGDVVKAIDRPKIELYSAFIGFLINFILNVLLIPRLGIVGAAVATVAGYTVYNIVELYAIYHHINITPFSTNILKPIVFTSVIALGFVWIVEIPSNIIFTVLSTILFCVISVLSLPLTRSVGDADRLLIKRLEQRTDRQFSLLRRLFNVHHSE